MGIVHPVVGQSNDQLQVSLPSGGDDIIQAAESSLIVQVGADLEIEAVQHREGKHADDGEVVVLCSNAWVQVSHMMTCPCQSYFLLYAGGLGRTRAWGPGVLVTPLHLKSILSMFLLKEGVGEDTVLSHIKHIKN